ncbi:gluconate 2-dehydrogenase subunit 3 family protein [Pedobacter hiemivivus]|uniref:gluconate 2-dehydrogenase subunit 3 family protein n=1 Tax=Pedobacter hiemivivus TaxID=2530454 RepID=UPI0013F15448|nr:gluconate 2-dehydrogenase subunit 3 family protein [Pedobacter hiemivivus]
MNRRTSIKSILGLSFIGASSFSVYKWINCHHTIDPDSFLSRKELIAELAETIIPSTDTPGAKEAKVENYIINILLNCTASVEQNLFLNGLTELESYTERQFQRTFFNCSVNDRNKILEYFEQRGVYKYTLFNKVSNRLLGKSFFSQLKSLTIDGYCLSQLGATRGLAYDYIPGNYAACISLTPNQKSWATK